MKSSINQIKKRKNPFKINMKKVKKVFIHLRKIKTKMLFKIINKKFINKSI